MPVKHLRKYLKRYLWAVKARQGIYNAKLWISDVSSAYLSQSTKMQMTPFGFHMMGSTSLHHLAMQKGDFDNEGTLLIKKLLCAADVFIDVGANIGFYVCLARCADKHVLAVEPLSNNLEYLYANIIANHWRDVEVFPVGLSDGPGLATLYGGSSTGASLIGRWAGASRLFRRTIAVTTLDILAGGRFADKRLLIKIDVEGAEYPVLLGATDNLRRHPKPIWIVEICFNEYHPQGMNPNFHDIFNLFWRYGYEAHTADQRNMPIQPADVDRYLKNGRCESGTVNYIFSAPDA